MSTANVTFACPMCDRPGRVSLERASDWQCPACDHRVHVEPPLTPPSPPKGEGEAALSHCVICGNGELYKKKDFPHWLGMSILVGACVGSVITYGMYEKWWTWAILLGSALVDGLLYLAVGDAVVCYRCHAHYRGIQPAEQHKPHELIIAERYRQERLRKEQIRSS